MQHSKRIERTLFIPGPDARLGVQYPWFVRMTFAFFIPDLFHFPLTVTIIIIIIASKRVMGSASVIYCCVTELCDFKQQAFYL